MFEVRFEICQQTSQKTIIFYMICGFLWDKNLITCEILEKFNFLRVRTLKTRKNITQ